MTARRELATEHKKAGQEAAPPVRP